MAATGGDLSTAHPPCRDALGSHQMEIEFLEPVDIKRSRDDALNLSLLGRLQTTGEAIQSDFHDGRAPNHGW